MLAIVFNQCCFTIGLSLTSPVNASIVTTTLPIVTMILAALFLKEPVTNKRSWGFLRSHRRPAAHFRQRARSPERQRQPDRRPAVSYRPMQLCRLPDHIQETNTKYTVVTCMKWMFTYATIVILPFTYKDLAILPWAEIPATTWFETAFVVFVATYLAYIMMMTGQKLLRPTIVSMYNYVQPIVACIVSVATGLGVFGWSQGAAVLLVFGGVWLVTQSKSRADLKTEHPSHTDPES